MHRLVRLSPFDSANRRQTSFAGRRGLAGRRGGRRRRDRRRRPADRHLPRVGRRRPARQQDRLGGPDHPQADRDRRAVPERALAVGQPPTAMAMLRSKLVELEERKRREEIAKERGEAQDVNFGSQIRSYVLHPYTMVKDHRTDFEVGERRARARRRPRRLRPRLPAERRRMTPAVSPAARSDAADRARTWRPSSPTASAARRASTCPATRAAPAPTPGCARRSASAR